MTKKISRTLESTRFAGAPIVAVAAKPGGPDAPDTEVASGVDKLIEALSQQLFVPERNSEGPFIFSVDHCFPIRGQGTVMTGTVLTGCVTVNDVSSLSLSLSLSPSLSLSLRPSLSLCVPLPPLSSTHIYTPSVIYNVHIHTYLRTYTYTHTFVHAFRRWRFPFSRSQRRSNRCRCFVNLSSKPLKAIVSVFV